MKNTNEVETTKAVENLGDENNFVKPPSPVMTEQERQEFFKTAIETFESYNPTKCIKDGILADNETSSSSDGDFVSDSSSPRDDKYNEVLQAPTEAHKTSIENNNIPNVAMVNEKYQYYEQDIQNILFKALAQYLIPNSVYHRLDNKCIQAGNVTYVVGYDFAIYNGVVDVSKLILIKEMIAQLLSKDVLPIEQYVKILLPININKSHWVLGVVYAQVMAFQDKNVFNPYIVFSIFDTKPSLESNVYANAKLLIDDDSRLFFDELSQSFASHVYPQLDMHKFLERYSIKNQPTNDFWGCGALVTDAILNLITGNILVPSLDKFTAADIVLIRQRHIEIAGKEFANRQRDNVSVELKPIEYPNDIPSVEELANKLVGIVIEDRDFFNLALEFSETQREVHTYEEQLKKASKFAHMSGQYDVFNVCAIKTNDADEANQNLKDWFSKNYEDVKEFAKYFFNKDTSLEQSYESNTVEDSSGISCLSDTLIWNPQNRDIFIEVIRKTVDILDVPYVEQERTSVAPTEVASDDGNDDSKTDKIFNAKFSVGPDEYALNVIANGDSNVTGPGYEEYKDTNCGLVKYVGEFSINDSNALWGLNFVVRVKERCVLYSAGEHDNFGIVHNGPIKCLLGPSMRLNDAETINVTYQGEVADRKICGPGFLSHSEAKSHEQIYVFVQDGKIRLIHSAIENYITIKILEHAKKYINDITVSSKELETKKLDMRKRVGLSGGVNFSSRVETEQPSKKVCISDQEQYSGANRKPAMGFSSIWNSLVEACQQENDEISRDEKDTPSLRLLAKRG